MATHPELEAEQAHVDRAYERLDQLRSDTEELIRSVIDQGRGGTHQFREERDVIVRTSLARLDQLDIGEQALCFGRIDRRDEDGAGARARAVESFHIGRLGISGEDLEPLVVDWRAPVAEPFYRATGRDPMGLVLRRHLAAQGRRIVGVEDERFGASPALNGSTPTAAPPPTPGHGIRRERGWDDQASDDGGDGELELGGPGALLAALEGARTGVMRDIVATIQREQDEIIRSALPGVMVVQGGPGTGKTAVALHRAAYLLYTHRFPLERQGVLVIGPNPLFLRYIEHVLPSLGESGVTLSTIEGLVHGVQVKAGDGPGRGPPQGRGPHVDRGGPGRAQPPAPPAPRRRGALRGHDPAAQRRGVGRDRLRGAPSSRAPTTPGAGSWSSSWCAGWPTSTSGPWPSTGSSPGDAEDTGLGDFDPGAPPEPDAAAGPQRARPQRAQGSHRQRARPGGLHGDGGRRSAGDDVDEESGFDLGEFSRQVRRLPEVTEALDRMWPRLNAEELLHDLFGSRPLLALAAKGVLSRRGAAPPSPAPQRHARPRSPGPSPISP